MVEQRKAPNVPKKTDIMFRKLEGEMTLEWSGWHEQMVCQDRGNIGEILMRCNDGR